MPAPPAKSAHDAHTTLTILGCGTSSGVPLLLCDCPVCTSRDPRDQRLRASAWVRWRGKSFLIDTSTDLRQQALRERIPRVDAVLYTHPHADHIHGIDELRSFNFIQKEEIPVYGNAWTRRELTQKFSYIFDPSGPAEGGGIPRLRFHEIDGQTPQFEVAGLPIIPISVRHGSQECLGFRFDRVAYVTDCSYVSPEARERLRGLEILVLDCLRLAPHGTHFNLDQALELIRDVRPNRTYLTHLSHEFEYAKWSRQSPDDLPGDPLEDPSGPPESGRLPAGVFLAYDGLRLSL